MEYIEVEFHDKKWKKLIRRADLKKPQWFAVEHETLGHPDFLNFTHSEFVAYIWICSVACKMNSPRVRIYPALCERDCRVSVGDTVSAITKLEDKRWVLVGDSAHNPKPELDQGLDAMSPISPVRDPYGPVRNPTVTRQDKTRQYSEINNKTLLPSSAYSDSTSADAERGGAFDLNEIYSHFPRKRGKSEGMKILKTIIKKQEDFDQVLQAVENFRSEMIRLARPEAKIPYFDTFMRSQWKDYITPEASEDFSQSRGERSQAEWDAILETVNQPTPGETAWKPIR
jgi:hypothetical protein